MHKVILYYNFQKIQDPEQFCVEHRKKCEALRLLGRIYIAKEGINGTVAGDIEDIENYKKYVWSLPGFADTEFKEEEFLEIPFVKLIVRVRPEIVTLKVNEELNPRVEGGEHLSPEQWRRVLETDKDYVLIDVRNNYESAIGHFEGAICPDVENFYDFPKWLDEAKLDKNKKVLMYCTGGIRCEKFSVFMKRKGFKDIYQLHGGIINYGKEEGGAHYKGKCFVFDDRLAVTVNPNDQEVVGKCKITGKPCDTYVNCVNMDCNNLFLCSQEGAIKMQGCCSEECMKSSRKRPFDPQNIYAPSRKWYQYYDDQEWSAVKNKSI